MDNGHVSQHTFTVLINEPVADGVYRMVMESSVAKYIAAGQFMNLHVPGDGSHILRIPLSFKRADAQDKTVELLYAVVGEGTQRLSQMHLGDTSHLVGPCGNGWSLPQTEGRALLVSGGIGLPPVFAAGEMLAAAGIPFDIVAGARTGAVLVRATVDEAARLCDDGRAVVCTDDGTMGLHCFPTDAMATLLEERSYTQVYTCGPAIMMAGVAHAAMEAGIDCQVSMERIMGCGFGACSCCNVPLAKGGYALCCQDGPVFEAREVAW